MSSIAISKDVTTGGSTTRDSNSRPADIDVTNQFLASVKFLGTGWNQNVRRVVVSLGSCADNAKAYQTGSTASWNFGTGFTSSARVAAFMAASPRCVILEASVTVLFRGALAGGSATVRSVWSSANDTAPSADADYVQLPSFEIDVSNPLGAGGVPAPIRRDLAVGQYGYSAQIKPCPLVGYPPYLAVRVDCDFAVELSIGSVAAEVYAAVILQRE